MDFGKQKAENIYEFFLKNHPYSKILTVKTFLDCVGGTDYPFLRKK